MDRLMKVYSKSILDAYIIIPDPSTDETDNRTSYFINWPMDLTDDDELPILQQYGLRSLGWSYKKSMTEGFYKNYMSVYLILFLVDQFMPQTAVYDTDIKDTDFLKNENGGIVYDPRKQYAPANLNRHRALSAGITDHHWNRLGLEGMVLALPWWETCKTVVPTGKKELAQTTGQIVDGRIDFEKTGENFCIYIDANDNIMQGEEHFGYWKTDITQPLDTEERFLLIDRLDWYHLYF